ncbi:hypothetical protein G6011_07381 [Alternaria panax]|uniref:DUF7730 domain-containing protein n=1 Tax=Alternaria panax TaxID=48097 RepID=A0AAD4FFH1_9PLEO|nr:hypothetical protein G6011_07381 [Alternaria panax]
MACSALDTSATLSRYEHENDRRTQANQVQSPFLCLPAELRNQIYRYTIKHGAINVYPTRASKRTSHALHLLWICRQIRAETVSLFFSTTVFGFETFCKIKTFARNLAPDQLQAIRIIKLLRYALVFCHDLSMFTSLERICVSSIWSDTTDDIVTRFARCRTGKNILKVEFDYGD